MGYRLCLWSRLANRVLLVLSRFAMNNADELYDGVQAVDWRDHLESSGSLAVEFSGNGSGIDNTHFGALKVKDAIVDRLRTAGGERPSIDKLNPDLRVHLRLDRGEAVLSLDLSGHSLHQRGYRLQQGAAPLKENLAAAVLIRAGWPRIAAEGGALADPMCGVGTFLVEAALMAADIAPNLRRERWGFSNWLGHVPAIWKKLHAEAEARAAAGLTKPPLWIRGYEADPRLIQPGRNNVERAGLSDWVKIYQGELGSFEPRPDQNQKGLVISNPPYGERLGDEASLHGQAEAGSMAGAMLMRGAGAFDRAGLSRELTRLRSTLSVGGNATAVSVGASTDRDHVGAILELLAAILRTPTFPEQEFAQLRTQAITGIRGSMSEPGALANQAMAQHFDPFPPGHPYHSPTFEQRIAALEADRKSVV